MSFHALATLLICALLLSNALAMEFVNVKQMIAEIEKKLADFDAVKTQPQHAQGFLNTTSHMLNVIAYAGHWYTSSHLSSTMVKQTIVPSSTVFVSLPDSSFFCTCSIIHNTEMRGRATQTYNG